MIETTTIIHKIRAELGITCDQYVIADTINQLHLRRKPSTIQAVATVLGMSEQAVDIDCKYLVAYDLIILTRPTDEACNDYKATKKWNEMFFDDKWFDNPLPRGAAPPPGYQPGFWQVYCSYRQGSDKGKTLAFYQQVIKNVDRNELLAATKRYLQYVAENSGNQYIMHAQRFLKPSAEHWVQWLDKKEDLNFVNTFTGFGQQQPIKDMTSMM